MKMPDNIMTKAEAAKRKARRRRLRPGVSVAALAWVLGVDESTLWRWETSQTRRIHPAMRDLWERTLQELEGTDSSAEDTTNAAEYEFDGAQDR